MSSSSEVFEGRAAGVRAMNVDLACAQYHRPRSTGINMRGGERVISGVAGALLVYAGLATRGLRRVALGGLGIGLLYRGISGHSGVYERLGVGRAEGIEERPLMRIHKAITVLGPRDELYRLWRDFENLPRFIAPLEGLHVLDEGRAEWILRGPGGVSARLATEIVEEVPSEVLRWRTVQGSRLPLRGYVRFERAPTGRGTEIHCFIEAEPPGGSAGLALSRALSRVESELLKQTLRRFKQFYETGTIATTKNQSSGERRRVRRWITSQIETPEKRRIEGEGAREEVRT